MAARDMRSDVSRREMESRTAVIHCRAPVSHANQVCRSPFVRPTIVRYPATGDVEEILVRELSEAIQGSSWPEQ